MGDDNGYTRSCQHSVPVWGGIDSFAIALRSNDLRVSKVEFELIATSVLGEHSRFEVIDKLCG